MCPCVKAYLVSLGGGSPHQFWSPFGQLANDVHGGPDIEFGKQVQDSMGGVNYAFGEIVVRSEVL